MVTAIQVLNKVSVLSLDETNKIRNDTERLFQSILESVNNTMKGLELEVYAQSRAK